MSRYKALILDEHLDNSSMNIIVIDDGDGLLQLESQDPDIPFTMYLWKEDLEAMLELLQE